jgi:hypothetical protein
MVDLGSPRMVEGIVAKVARSVRSQVACMIITLSYQYLRRAGKSHKILAD